MLCVKYWLSRTRVPIQPPETFVRVIRTLMDPGDAVNEGPARPGALALLNTALAREGFEAFYGPDRQCHLRHVRSGTVAGTVTSLTAHFLQPNVRGASFSPPTWSRPRKTY